MKWGEILRKSWEYIKHYKALWYLGILAALTEGGVSGNFGSSNSSWKPKQEDFEKYGNQVSTWVQNHYTTLFIALLAIIIISIVILYVSYSARAGLISSVNALEESDKKPSFRAGFHSGRKYFWRFLGLTVLVALIIFALVFMAVFVAGSLIVLSIGVSLWFLILAIPFSLASILGIIALVIYFNLLLQFAYRTIVIKNKKIIESINAAREIIRHNLSNALLAWLIEVAFYTAIAIGFLIAGLIIVTILAALGFAIYSGIGATFGWVYIGIVSLVALVAILILSGVINAYFSTYWTIIYKRLSN